MPVGAADSDMTWGAYRASVNDGELVKRTPPATAYTDEGFHVTLRQGMADYIVQSTTPIDLSKGFYWEFELDSVVEDTSLFFHLTNQYDVCVKTGFYGSGWVGVVSPGENTHMLGSINYRGVDDPKGETSNLSNIMGFAAGQHPLRFVLELRNGTLYVNNIAMPDNDKIMKHLREVSPDGCMYVGVTIATTKAEGEASGMTVRRFGRDKASATIPGTKPETTKPTPETTKPTLETTKPTPETAKPIPETTKPATETTKPTSETTRPISETTKPGVDPVDPPKPDDPIDTAKPVDSDDLPKPDDPVNTARPDDPVDPPLPDDSVDPDVSSDSDTPTEPLPPDATADPEDSTAKDQFAVAYDKVNIFTNCLTTISLPGAITAILLLTAVGLACRKPKD